MNNRIRVILGALVAVLTACATIDSTPPPASPTALDIAHNDWMAQCLKEMDTIKVGSTRADLLKVFQPAGGLSSPGGGTFIYRGCWYIAVDVNFAFARDKNDENRAIEQPEDKIIKISKPMVEITPAD